MSQRSARFEKYVNVILKNEGGYVNDPKDPGGETKYGISKRAYPHEDIKNLTIQRAKDIYYHDYYMRVNADCFIDPLLALSLFDFAVNAGVGRAIKMLQTLAKVDPDGKIESLTINAANNTKCIGELYQTYRRSYYKARPNFKRYGKGWLNRVNSLYDEV